MAVPNINPMMMNPQMMAMAANSGIPEQVLPIPFGPGVDTKTDPKAVPAGRLLQLQNAVFTDRDRLEKRPGYKQFTTAILRTGNLVAPSMVTTFGSSPNQQILCQDQETLYSYSPNLNVWVPSGPYVSMKVTNKEVASSSFPQTLQSACLVGNFSYNTWCQSQGPALDSSVGVKANLTIYDINSNTTFFNDIVPLAGGAFGATYQGSKTIALGGTVPATILLNGSGNLVALLYSLTSSGLSTTSATIATAPTMTSASYNGGYFSSTVPLFDALNTPTGGVVAYLTHTVSTDTLNVKTINTSGTVTNSYSTLLGNQPTLVSVSVDYSNGNIWVFTADLAKNANCTVFDSSLNVIHTFNPFFTSSFGHIKQITSVQVFPTVQRVYVSYLNNVSTISTDIYEATLVASGSTIDSGLWINNFDIAGRPLFINGISYLPVIFRSNIQGTMFLIGADGFVNQRVGPYVVAKYAMNSAFNTILPPGYIASVLPFSATDNGIFIPQSVTTDTINSTPTQLTNSVLVSFDFGSSEAYQSITAQGLTILNGGQLWQFDGLRASEVGFNLYPEFVSTSVVGSGGSLSAGTYSYAVIAQWTDAQGNLQQSAPSFISVTVGANNLVNLVILLPSGFLKILPSSPRLAIFRTQVNATFYTLINNTIIINGNAATYQDGASDASIANDDALYTNGGVLDNNAPPPAMSMCIFNNRLWAVNTLKPNVVSYTKTFNPGFGLNFSDNLFAQINPAGGPIVSLSGMDANLVFFSTLFPLIMQGDGANDAGQGSTLTSAQPIPSDAGGIDQRSVIVFPGGILRKTSKGIYLLNRALQDSYFGMDVEKYNSQNITAATLMSSLTQIRFLTGSGLTLIYDYVMGQWGTFTNVQGFSACISNGLYTYARTDGTIYQETPGVYLDNTAPFNVLIQTSWMALGSIQGFQRVKQFLSLGDFVDGTTAGHGVSVSAAYDFQPNFTALSNYTFAQSGQPSPYQYRGFLPKQKCDSISLLIQEVTTGDSAEYMDIVNMAFLASLKKGINKIPAALSTG